MTLTQKLRLCPFILLQLCILHADAQLAVRKKLDSLIQVLPVVQSDSARVTVWNELASAFDVIHPDSGLMYANKALEASTKKGWRKQEVWALSHIGNNYYRKGNYDKALQYLFESQNKNKQEKDSTALVITSMRISHTYSNLEDYERSYTNITDALKVATSVKDKSLMPGIYLGMGILYSNLNKLDSALYAYNKALHVAEETNNKVVVSYAHSNSGSIYQMKEEWEKALEYHNKALVVEEELGDIYGMGTEYSSMSTAYIGLFNKHKQQGKSFEYLLDSAIHYAQKGIAFCKQCDDLQDMTFATFSLAEAYALKKQFEKALETFQLATTLKDSLFSSESQRNIRQVESAQLVALHNREVQVLQAEKKLQRNYYLLGSLVLGLVALVIFSRLQTIRKTRRKLESMNAVLTTEKKRSDDLLLNILPMEVAEELKSNGSAAAKQYNNVSVLFTDFADFTGISEQMSPSELVAEIHRHFTAFDAIIEKHALEKIKTIGDAYMAVCGLPHETVDHATRTVAAALEIRNYMRNAQSLFNVRIGIHSGAVVAGIVGIKKFAYDIWGDTVNTASRMESNSEIGKVNISSATYELVKDHFACTQRGKIQVKGKGDIEMYFAEDKVAASIH